MTHLSVALLGLQLLELIQMHAYQTPRKMSVHPDSRTLAVEVGIH